MDHNDQSDGRHQTGPAEKKRAASASVAAFPEAQLYVSPWDDPVLDNLGHDPRSVYVERFWLPILGPSCLLLARRLAVGLEAQPEGFDIVCADWAQELGIGMRTGRHGPFWRAIDRACRFGITRRNGSRLVARRRLPPLTVRQADRLPSSLGASHQAWQAERLAQPRRASLATWRPSGEGDGLDTAA